MKTFEIRTEYVDVVIPLTEKYAIISGDSERGKSFLVAEVGRIKESGLDGIVCPYRVEVVRTRGELDSLEKYSGEFPVVVVVDEFYVHDVLQLSNQKAMYVIGISRKNYRNINMSYKSLYKAYRDEKGVTRVKPEYTFSESCHTPICFDEILVEDERAGLEFFQKLYGSEVRSCKGKPGICKALAECEENSSVLLIADGGGIASEIGNIYNRIEEIKQLGIKVVLCLPVCFEFLLLCSGFIGYDTDIYNSFKLEYNNTEYFSECMLLGETRDTVLEYSHQKQNLSKCWFENCKLCSAYEECKFKTAIPKFIHILRGGPNPELLNCSIRKE